MTGGDNKQDCWQLAEDWLAGRLAEDTLIQLQQRLESDQAFADEFQECTHLLRTLETGGKRARFQTQLTDIRNDAHDKKHRFSFRNHYMRTAAMAAGIALLTSLTTVWVVTHNEQKRTSQYRLLKRELETIRRSQHALIQDIHNKEKAVPVQPEAPANYSGTGFALNNHGVFLTNYHVTSGADSVFIQTGDGNYHKAHLVTFDEKTDIAILKVDNRKFRFSKTEVPYTFAVSRRKIGARVFTLGFPGEDIVYNEGYISSRNGFMGDSMQYRLEIPANPGQSGAPVMDAAGYVVAIVTGQESGLQGTTTYAVSSEAIHELLKTLPKEIRIPKNNKLGSLSREKQIEKLETYTCAVKVYKR